MSYKSDIEIAREAQKKPIQEIGAKIGISSDDLLPYGHDKAKVSQGFINSVQSKEDGKLSEEKKKQMGSRLNILRSFSQAEGVKDEL